MIYGFFSGKILSLEDGDAIILPDHAGVGYSVSLVGSLLADLRIGAQVQIWIYHHITENGQRLFGFADLAEKTLFLTLLKVDGVGPKAASGLMALGRDVLLSAIAGADEAKIKSAPGVGPKLAKKVILELSGVLVPSAQKSIPKAKEKERTVDDDITLTLIGLGYDRDRVKEVLSALPQDQKSVAARTRLALQALARV